MADVTIDELHELADKFCFVELDTMRPDDPALLEDLKRLNIAMELIQRQYNWPIYRYVGRFESLCELIRVHWEDDDLIQCIQSVSFI